MYGRLDIPTVSVRVPANRLQLNVALEGFHHDQLATGTSWQSLMADVDHPVREALAEGELRAYWMDVELGSQEPIDPDRWNGEGLWPSAHEQAHTPRDGKSSFIVVDRIAWDRNFAPATSDVQPPESKLSLGLADIIDSAIRGRLFIPDAVLVLLDSIYRLRLSRNDIYRSKILSTFIKENYRINGEEIHQNKANEMARSLTNPGVADRAITGDPKLPDALDLLLPKRFIVDNK